MAKILLQFPEGLKVNAFEYKEQLEKEGHIVYTSSSPCFGACDLALEEAKAMGVDKIVHFGHNKFIKHNIDIEVEYIPWREDINLNVLSNAVELFKKERIDSFALTTTVQHSHQIKEMKEFFSKNGLKALTSRGFWAREEGQILGCDVKAAMIKEAKAILYIGSGYFHPLAFFGIEKKIFVLNHRTGEIKEISKEMERLKKKRRGLILKAVDAEKFLVLVSTKPGQYFPKRAEFVKKELEKRGKSAIIAVSNNIVKDSVENFMADAYVNTACPRILDDVEAYQKPLLNIDMFMELLNIWDSMKGEEQKHKADPFYWVGGYNEK